MTDFHDEKKPQHRRQPSVWQKFALVASFFVTVKPISNNYNVIPQDEYDGVLIASQCLTSKAMLEKCIALGNDAKSKRKKPVVIINLLEEFENNNGAIGVLHGEDYFQEEGIEYHHHPMRDYDQTATTIGEIKEVVDKIINALETKKICIVHCKAGVGRTGLVAWCAIMETLKKNPDEALAYVKRYRRVSDNLCRHKKAFQYYCVHCHGQKKDYTNEVKDIFKNFKFNPQEQTHLEYWQDCAAHKKRFSGGTLFDTFRLPHRIKLIIDYGNKLAPKLNSREPITAEEFADYVIFITDTARSAGASVTRSPITASLYKKLGQSYTASYNVLKDHEIVLGDDNKQAMRHRNDEKQAMRHRRRHSSISS